MREAVMAHSGEALESRVAFTSLTPYNQDSIIEFLKSLQILPKGARSLCVDEDFHDTGCPAGINPYIAIVVFQCISVCKEITVAFTNEA